MKKVLKSKKGVAALASTLVVAIGALGAYAYFTSTGTGTGTATVGTSTAWDVTSDSATGDALLPGSGLSQTVAYHVQNDSDGYQKLEQVDISVATSTGDAWDGNGTCSKDDFKVGAAAAGATLAQLPERQPGAGRHL